MAYQVNEEESVQHILQRVRIDMENICTHINRKMSSGELPKVKYDYVLREGLPEEEIIAYSKEYHPTLIVMGTRGKSQKDMDLIGSVTGEVIEVNRVPVLAIPENVPFTDLRISLSLHRLTREIWLRLTSLWKSSKALILISIYSISLPVMMNGMRFV